MAGRKPDYTVSAPVEKSDGSTKWMNIGAAWRGDGDKITITLDALPLGSRLMLFTYTEREVPKGDGFGTQRQQRPTAFDSDLDDVPF